MKKTALLIMAAGMGSRFGEGIKQLTPIGPGGEIIMDYSIHDAIAAGFNKVIFVIRKQIEADFREMIGDRIEAVCRDLGVEVAYAFQDLADIPEGREVPEGRTKPWGTGHAILAARRVIDCPFAVINADDYYGKEGYRLLHDHLVSAERDNQYAMAGFILGNTLSENGGVSRGICRIENGYLADVVETYNIVRTAEGAASEGKYVDPASVVSMNMWGLSKEFVSLLEGGFVSFFDTLSNPLKDEYMLPMFLRELLAKDMITIRVLETSSQWFGVTYQQDRQDAIARIRELIAKGVYSASLYSDLK